MIKICFKLSSRITLYVNKTAELFAKCFGGSTSTPALGYWLSQNAGLVKEKTTLVFAFCSDQQLQEHIDQVVNFCEQLKTKLKQEAIALEINGEMYFI